MVIFDKWNAYDFHEDKVEYDDFQELNLTGDEFQPSTTSAQIASRITSELNEIKSSRIWKLKNKL